MQEGKHSSKGAAASEAQLDSTGHPVRGGLPSNDNDSFSVTPLLIKVRPSCRHVLAPATAHAGCYTWHNIVFCLACWSHCRPQP